MSVEEIHQMNSAFLQESKWVLRQRRNVYEDGLFGVQILNFKDVLQALDNKLEYTG